VVILHMNERDGAGNFCILGLVNFGSLGVYLVCVPRQTLETHPRT